VDYRIKWTVLAYLVPLYAAAMFGTTWAAQQLFPATAGPPRDGYARTTATVEAAYPNDHDQVRYSYRVGDRTFVGVWFADGPQGHASSLKVGQAITIWYEVGDPSKSCDCVNPQELQRTNNDPTPLVLALLLLLTVGFVLIAGRLMLGRWLAIIQWARELSAGSFNTVGRDPGTRP
jgi:hypothetical protein